MVDCNPKPTAKKCNKPKKPGVAYTKGASLNHHSKEISKIAVDTLKRASKKAEDASKVEYQKKMRCLEHEKAIQKKRIDCSEITTPKPKKQKLRPATILCVGDYVTVKEDLSPGFKSFGGTGHVNAGRVRDRCTRH